MASADQLKALLRSHLEGDDEHFFSVAMQVAAHEAKSGHGKLAEELRTLIDEAKRRCGADSVVPIARPSGELAELLEASYPKARLIDMVLSDVLSDQIQRVIRDARRTKAHCRKADPEEKEQQIREKIKLEQLLERTLSSGGSND